jgi:hypothetical protein
MGILIKIIEKCVNKKVKWQKNMKCIMRSEINDE